MVMKLLLMLQVVVVVEQNTLLARWAVPWTPRWRMLVKQMLRQHNHQCDCLA